MTNDLTFFNPHTSLNVAIRQDTEGRFCLNDLHRASGCQRRAEPTNWLNLKSMQALRAELESTTGIPAVVTINGGPKRGTYVCKDLVYAYAMWISPVFHLEVIRCVMDAQGNDQQTPQLAAPVSMREALLQAVMLEEARELASGTYLEGHAPKARG